MTQPTSAARVPMIGYGTWNRTSEETHQGVLWALEAGYRHIDTAQGYHNEQDVGRALRDSGLPRSEVFLTTKIGPENYGPGQVMRSARESLDKLGVEQADLLLLHWPSPHDEYPLESYISQFAEVYDAGMAKRIGLSNFTIPLLDATMKLLGERPISMNQIEIHVYLQNRNLVGHCRKLGIPTTAYSPLARGAVVGDPLLTEIGKAHGATAEQVALAVLLAEGHVVIPSSAKRERILSNLAAAQIELTPAEVERTRSLEKGLRLSDGDWTPVWDD